MRIPTALLRKTHRVFGVVIGVQLLLWTISGAFFAWADIDDVRGEPNRMPPDGFAVTGEWIPPTRVDFGAVTGFDTDDLAGLGLVHIGEATYYRFVDGNGMVLLADVLSGSIRAALDENEAIALARASFVHPVPVRSTRRITDQDVGPHHEYRGGMLPAWVIQFEHPSGTRVYVSENGGQVTRHRNTLWRAFDFLWMLHTMDYRGRDDFNHSLLRIVSVLAVVLAISGYLLWGRTSVMLRRRRSP